MANLTVEQVLQQVDALLPNQYSETEKMEWLCRAEGFVVEEILRCYDENILPPQKLTLRQELLVEPPYDGLYRHYIEAQIHYANGEMERYNNAATAWNNALVTYRDYYCRHHLPRQDALALKLM